MLSTPLPIPKTLTEARLSVKFSSHDYFFGNKSLYAALNTAYRTASTVSGVCFA